MPGPFVVRAGRGGVFSIMLVTALVAAGATAEEEVLFPEPLHFVREVTGIDGDTSVFHEYCAGNQVVTVTEGRVSVADHAKGELLEIDHTAGTYSITSFTDLAAAAPPTQTRASALKNAAPGAQATVGMTSDAIVLENGVTTVELRAHESISVPRRTLDVLLGAAWPTAPSAEHDLAAEALRAQPGSRRLQPIATGEAAERFAIPASRIVTTRIGPDVVRWQSAIVAVDNARVPASALIVPAGFRLVESVKVRLPRELRALESNPGDPQQ